MRAIIGLWATKSLAVAELENHYLVVHPTPDERVVRVGDFVMSPKEFVEAVKADDSLLDSWFRTWVSERDK